MSSLRIIARDPIDIIRNPSQYAVNTLGLNTASGFNPSALEREQIAYSDPVVYSEQSRLRKAGISSRGLLDQTRTSQSVFVPPMIQNNAELVQKFTRPVSGKASNPKLSQERVAIGQKLMANSQSVWSSRLY